MLADIVSLAVTLAMFGTPMIFFAHFLLRRQAELLGVPPRIRWVGLLITTIIVGGLFSSAWLIPVICLLPADEGPQKAGPIDIAMMVIGQTVAMMPVLCGLPSVARRFLPAPMD